MLKNYIDGIDMFIESLNNLKVELEDENLDGAANYFTQSAYYSQMFFLLLRNELKQLNDEKEEKMNSFFPDIIEDD